ncbi:MAPEG family protein [Luteimonas terrae]|uniref:Membrane protein YecN with MAPEG domain n=1 Tax=Luteimonas terrae TaxID=1530191 RepID=A0ABU1XZC1_9GAMM|nr:MAPEG family protein [Luteimonas terrae]MDR7194129.1 putative membrane protein YecN with MAPEG domain [Luteimonas terrae]
MTPRISLLIASLHVLLYLVLTIRVVMHRNVHKIGIGTGGDEALSRKVRVHANFVEYVPLGLLLLALLELAAINTALLWTFGIALLVARVLHAIGLGGSAGYSFGRATGALLTFATLLAMAGFGIWRFVIGAMIVA